MARHDVSALIASFRDNYPDLLRFLTRRTGDAARAADVAQDTYIRLATLAPASLEVENPRAYVYRVAGNLAIDTLRREGRIANDFTFVEATEAVPDSAPSPEATVFARERLRLLEAALDELPPKPRLALLLNRVEGRTFAEIAAQLAVSESMVAKYIARALRHCRDRLRDSDQE
jgi:RNA polymerase sigma factor (sigma-70 family)